MNNKIKIVKNCIGGLKKEENRKKFINELFEAQNPEKGKTIIYFDFNKNNLFCKCIPAGTIIPNSMMLYSTFDVFSEKSVVFKEFAEGIIHNLGNTNNWVYFDEKGKKDDIRIFRIKKFKEDSIELTNIELIKKYNIRYDDILKLRKELNISSKKEPKYYSFNKFNNKWFIQNNRTYYGSFETEEEAKKAVEVLKRNNWNEELFKSEKKEPKYYFFHKNNNKWEIVKRDKYFGSFETEEEAQKAVDFLKENNWNKEMLQKYMKKIPNYYYFHKKSEKWHVKKGGTYYGVYTTEKGAKRAVEFLKSINWDKELFKRRWGISNPSYYYFNGNTWVVQKNRTYYGSFETVEKAKKAIDFLKENNWDKELLLENKDKILGKGGEKA